MRVLLSVLQKETKNRSAYERAAESRNWRRGTHVSVLIVLA
jgi:hypothetical protein